MSSHLWLHDPVAEYDPVAEWDDGSCIILADACNDQTALTYGGVSYELAVIGDQCWFAEQLEDEGTFSNGDLTARSRGSFDWYLAGANDETAYAYAGATSENASEYGFLYNGIAVTDSRGLCPGGMARRHR